MKKRVFLHLKALLVWNEGSRPWHLPLVAALCVAIPAFIGAASNDFATAILASMGAMVILYMPPTRTAHRMLTITLCSFGFMVCFTLGSIASFNPYIASMALVCLVFLAVLITRYYRLPPPGSFFFVLISCVAITLPFDLHRLPTHVGMVALGGMLSCMLAFFYSLAIGANRLAVTQVETDSRVNAIILEAALMALLIGGSYAFAVSLSLNNPYWVPISCAAILQGATFRMVWHRNIHRIAGTTIGMGVVWCVFIVEPNFWVLAICVFVFQFITEFLIVKHYGFAVIFITPLTVIMAEVTNHNIPASLLVEYRLIDICIGSAIGCMGGAIFHRTSLLKKIEARMNERTSLSGTR
ncbi:FUSC family protein [Marinomonas spartinae]|uniref:FUSC family protein n=1 Tax=Marinomonas spartinae TaxID=1792290 RepID=UPI0018F1F4C7|nr:FUSC family protein [Marinomonas spartinae]MBJ7555678.1 FUSC family protein [Marinomonas spartinae]